MLVGGGKEEHVARLDERAVVGIEHGAVEPFLDPVCEPAGVEPVLKLPVSFVVEAAHRPIMRLRRSGVQQTAELPG